MIAADVAQSGRAGVHWQQWWPVTCKGNVTTALSLQSTGSNPVICMPGSHEQHLDHVLTSRPIRQSLNGSGLPTTMKLTEQQMETARKRAERKLNMMKNVEEVEA